MLETITIDIPGLLAWCSLITAVGVAISWLVKAAKPITRPIKEMDDQIKALQEHREKCAAKFSNDQERLDKLEDALAELKEDNRKSMESIALLLKHAETGNCTGEITKGRHDLEKYLINRQ